MAVIRIDLGRVLGLKGVPGADGAPGAQGPRGFPGRSLLFDAVPPDPDTGSDGDVYIDSSTGQVYRKEKTIDPDTQEETEVWTEGFKINLAGAIVDEAIDAESHNPVRNSAIAVAIDDEAAARAAAIGALDNSLKEYVDGHFTTGSAVIARNGSAVVPAAGSTLTIERKGFMGNVRIDSLDTWPCAKNNVPYIFEESCWPLFPQYLPATGTIAGVADCEWIMRLDTNGRITVATNPVRPGGNTITGACTKMSVFGCYVGRW